MDSVNAILNDGLASAIRSMAILAVLVLLVAGVVTLFIGGGISKPVKKVADAAQRIADGDFNMELSVHSKDEVGELVKAFNLTIKQLVNYQGYIDEVSDVLYHVANSDFRVQLRMEYAGQFKKLKDNMTALLKNLNSTILQITESAQQVNSSADQVSDGAQALSQSATQQASSVEELSSSITETAAQIQRNAQNAQSAHEKAEIAIAFQEQAESTAQINEGVEPISAVVQNNAATAEQSAAASEELTAQSVTMQELISRFQLRDSVSARSDSPAETETRSAPEDIPAPIGSKY